MLADSIRRYQTCMESAEDIDTEELSGVILLHIKQGKFMLLTERINPSPSVKMNFKVNALLSRIFKTQTQEENLIKVT